METSFAVLTIVVWILIIAAGMLAFIVLYNLNSMNIAERIRELSTMKVLGFFSKEVTLYVFRENIVLSLFGIMFGLFAGIFLHHFVIQTVEMDTTLFVQTMHWQSYLYAGSITFLFTLVVGVVMHHQLQKINMLDALKANE
ncbi:ABC transporter permease [Enterococcus italicus]|uniref:ABC transporter permease n=1 Tax=Enterococcus italicus TaxID=246144 RepID=UPI002074397B|nr:ABC transporter permease [Enterococcus italicus]